jgi:hypothetical protein
MPLFCGLRVALKNTRTEPRPAFAGHSRVGAAVIGVCRDMRLVQPQQGPVRAIESEAQKEPPPAPLTFTS